METEAAARAWVEGWKRAWPARDAGTIAAMYADGVIFSSHPFRAPDTAHNYAVRAFGEEDLVRAWFGEPVVSGDRAAVEYWALLRTPAGDDMTIAGVAFLCFGRDGRVTQHRDYWVQTDGSREPPSGWGE